MSTTLPRSRRSTTRPAPAHRTRTGHWHDPSAPAASAARSHGLGGERLGSYVDDGGRPREIVCCVGATGSSLVIDRDRLTCADRRLLAHLAVDEPVLNARLICELYLRNPDPARCRRVTEADLRAAPASEIDGQAQEIADAAPLCEVDELCDAAGNGYRLSRMPSGMSIPQLRWCRSTRVAGAHGGPLSVRDVVAALESYEPVRALSAEAIRRHRDDHALSVATLIIELDRLSSSRVVLNRRLREAVLTAVEGSDLSMSEIALRCGRTKRDRRGVLSGETTWLARRIGLVGDGGASQPSPWVHSDVLALIARSGLGVAPREVELA